MRNKNKHKRTHPLRVLSNFKPKSERAFTLIETVIVVFIIGMLASIVTVSLVSARAKARDADRRANLRALHNALELYVTENGSYPNIVGRQGCIQTSFSGATYYQCGQANAFGNFGTDANGYIPNMVPNYLDQLPDEPLKNQNTTYGFCTSIGQGYTGYVYMNDGKDYKVIDLCGPEHQVDTTDPFYDIMRPQYSLQISSPGAVFW